MPDNKKHLVVLSGSGISAESGLKTFRDSDGLWENYNVMDVASIEGWLKNPQLVLEFYNERRRQLKNAQPNDAHKIIAELENYFNVYIITQNVDDLHERAGSKNVLHLHGILTQAKSTGDDSIVYDIGYNDIKWGDKCKKGYQLRPNIVWFGEPVPLIVEAQKLVERADIFVIIGTSLLVYPAAGLVDYVKPGVPIFVIDPKHVEIRNTKNVYFIQAPATIGTKKLKDILIQKYLN